MLLDHARFARLRHDQVEFLRRYMLLGLALQAHQAEQQGRGRIEQPHNRRGDRRQHADRPRHHRRQRLGRAQRDLFGHQLPDHQRGIGRDADDDGEADRFGRLGAQPEEMEPRRDRSAEACAGIGARENADQRDADLRRRQDLARVRRQRQRGARAALAAARHRLQPRFARGHDRQFRHGEHAVQNDQRENDRDVDPGKGGWRGHGALFPSRRMGEFTTMLSVDAAFRSASRDEEISE